MGEKNSSFLPLFLRLLLVAFPDELSLAFLRLLFIVSHFTSVCLRYPLISLLLRLPALSRLRLFLIQFLQLPQALPCSEPARTRLPFPQKAEEDASQFQAARHPLHRQPTLPALSQ